MISPPSSSRHGATGFPSILILLCLASTFVSRPTFAQEEDRCGLAAEHFATAMRATEEDALNEAARDFAESHRLCPQPGTLRNLALTLEATGDRPAARGAWADLVETYGEAISEEAAEHARARLADLGAALARLTVSCDPVGAVALVDGVDFGPAASMSPLFVEPGRHVAECRTDEGEGEARVVELEAGERMTLAVAIVPPSLPRETTDTAPPVSSMDEALLAAPRDAIPRDTEPRPTFLHGPWPWVIGALVVVGVGAATTTALLWPEPAPEADLSISIR